MFEELALEVRARAGLDDDELAYASEIAARILGVENVSFTDGTVARFENGRILIPSDHPDCNYAAAHEIAEWALRELARFDGTERERERAANYVGAAILSPARVVLKAHRQFGERLRTLAKTFAMSQTGIVLRLAEVEGSERAVVTRTGNVLFRTQGAFPWANVVSGVARGETRWRGLAKTELRGGIDEGRVALRVR